MSHLSVQGLYFSVTKQKAIEDAKKMQSVVEEECLKDGKTVPPYRLQELIGKGSFGRVYKASSPLHKQTVAVKIIDIEESDTLNPKNADTYSEFLKEINALKLLSEGGAKNVNHVLDALPVGQAMWMVTEYCAGGSVSTLMQPTAPGGLQEKWIVPILREVAEAIYWVHKQGIIHRDIKCANVLITEPGGVQLCDFGVSGVIETKFDKRSTFIGTPHWMAPELFDPSASYGIEVDIWAFGSLIFEIASGLPPNATAGFSVPQLGSYVKQHVPRLEGRKYSEPLKDLVAFCLVEDPAKRPTIEQVQQHQYIFNTSSTHPRASLSMLVRAFRLWESQGGARKSLFNPGGAQGPMDLSSVLPSEEEWNFSTTRALDQGVMDHPDAQAVYDVYGTNVELSDFMNEQSYQTVNKPKSRRRPPPQISAVKAPLEKLFDPNTMTNYEENSRMYYGYPAPPPPGSDLPLRDDSLHATLRESLIDLDMSFGNDLASYADMDTIKVRQSTDYHSTEPFDTDVNDVSRSDFQTVMDNRKTQEWKFPSMTMPATTSTATEMAPFPFGRLESPPPTTASASFVRPQLLHHATEPMHMPSQNYELSVPRIQDNRISTGSLIDLDASFADPSSDEMTRPSTSHSDAVSVSGSDMGAFDLERHTSYQQPMSSVREPSIYVTDESDYNHLRAPSSIGIDSRSNSREPRARRRDTGRFVDDAFLYNGNENYDSYNFPPLPRDGSIGASSGYNGGFQSEQDDDTFSMTVSSQQTKRTSYVSNGGRNGVAGAPAATVRAPAVGLPPLPMPPSANVMGGEGGRELRDEFSRLLEGMIDHLGYTRDYVSNLPVERGGGTTTTRLDLVAQDGR